MLINEFLKGLCKYLFSVYGDELKTKGVVVGYDGRHHSLEFARKTAAAFLSQGVKVYLYSVLVPTPFVVRDEVPPIDMTNWVT